MRTWPSTSAAYPGRHRRPRDGAAALAGARARRRLRRPLLRAPPHLVAAARRGHHPHRLGGRDLRPGRARGLGRAHRLRLHRRPVLGGHGARGRDRGPHRLGHARPCRPQPVSPAPVERRYGETDAGRARPRRAHRARGARRPRGARLRPAHREGDRLALGRDEARAHRQLRGRAGRGRAAAVLDPRLRDRGGARACAARAARAAAGAWGRSSSTARPPEHFAREAARMAITLLGAVGGAGRRRCRWCWRRAGPASCCTKPWATASKATSTARAPPRSPAASASAWRRRA